MRQKALKNANLVASRHIKREIASLPVDVRRSKTSLLKPANTFGTHNLRGKSQIFRGKLQKIWVVI